METQAQALRLSLVMRFKSYYVVWKLENRAEEISSGILGLNRTM